jgi:hypothetical protein
MARAPWEVTRNWFESAVHKLGGGGSAPAAPDPAQTAAAQAAANKDTAIAQAQLNMVNQTDAFGNKLTYNQRGTSPQGTPQYEAIQTLSPEQQALANKAQGIYGQGLDTATNLFGQLQGTLGTAAPQYDENYRQQQLAAMLQRQQPRLDQQRQALETQLANQGITLGSQAYNDAIGNYDRSVNDLSLAADVNAGNEARSAYQTLLGGRSQGINELTGLLGLGQVQSPQFANTPQTGIANTDVIGPTNMAYQGQLANWQAGQNRGNATLGGISGLAGNALGGWAALGFPSDARIKHSLEHKGYRSGLPVYDFSYIGSDERHTGFLAQDVEKLYPDAVSDIRGIKHVRYDLIPEA